MDLRPELLPPQVAPERLARISGDIERIADLLFSGGHAEADEAIADFNARTSHQYSISDFMEYEGWRSLEDFAREAARPAAPRVHDITREELVEIVHRIRAGDPEVDYYLLVLETNVLRPHASDLIFHPPIELRDATAESIVDAALSYRPFAL